jgi:hypothetical protein
MTLTPTSFPGIYVLLPLPWDGGLFNQGPTGQATMLNNMRTMLELNARHPAVLAWVLGNEVNLNVGYQVAWQRASALATRLNARGSLMCGAGSPTRSARFTSGRWKWESGTPSPAMWPTVSGGGASLVLRWQRVTAHSSAQDSHPSKSSTPATTPLTSGRFPCTVVAPSAPGARAPLCSRRRAADRVHRWSEYSSVSSKPLVLAEFGVDRQVALVHARPASLTPSAQLYQRVHRVRRGSAGLVLRLYVAGNPRCKIPCPSPVVFTRHLRTARKHRKRRLCL